VAKAHPFFFTSRKRDKSRDVRAHELIDTFPNQLVVEGLRPLGFELGEARINNPPRAGQRVDPMQLTRVDTNDCHPDDVIVTTTWWPVSDENRDDRKRMPRAHTDLEKELLEVWERYFPELARARVRLSPDLHPLLPAGYEDRFDMRFRERQGAPYLSLQRHDDNRRPYKGNELRTAVFLSVLAGVPRRKVGYVGAWGLDGIATLVWAALLRERHAALLGEPGLVMAELVGAPIPRLPTDYRWIREWRAEILFRFPVGSPPQQLGSARPAARRPQRAA
jgi:hypothetical protein